MDDLVRELCWGRLRQTYQSIEELLRPAYDGKWVFHSGPRTSYYAFCGTATAFVADPHEDLDVIDLCLSFTWEEESLVSSADITLNTGQILAEAVSGRWPPGSDLREWALAQTDDASDFFVGNVRLIRAWIQRPQA